MAITVSAVKANAPSKLYKRSWDIVATADSDESITWNHGVSLKAAELPNEALDVIFENLLPEAGSSRWRVTNRTKTSITVAKENAPASGAALAQVRVHVIRTGSLVNSSNFTRS